METQTFKHDLVWVFSRRLPASWWQSEGLEVRVSTFPSILSFHLEKELSKSCIKLVILFKLLPRVSLQRKGLWSLIDKQTFSLTLSLLPCWQVSLGSSNLVRPLKCFPSFLTVGSRAAELRLAQGGTSLRQILIPSLLPRCVALWISASLLMDFVNCLSFAYANLPLSALKRTQL